MNKETKSKEKEYLKLDAPVLQNVSDLVQGKRDIKEEELKDLDKYLTEEEKAKVNENLGARKIPDYWFKVMSNASVIKESIGTEDAPLLKAIENIHVVDEEGTDNFTIVFEIGENDLITNKQLTKKFYLKNDEPVKCEASPIEWVSKNLTVKHIKKKQKNKKTGQQRVVDKVVEAKSFFTFFRSLEAPEVNELEANEEQLQKRENLDNDFELGGMLVDEVLPYSLEYFLGIEHEGDEDYDEDLEEGEGSDDDGDKKSKSKDKSKEKSKGKAKKAATEEKPECKNQ